MRSFPHLSPFVVALLHLGAALHAADLKPDATTEIPASARREVVIRLEKPQLANFKAQAPKADLPPGFELQVVAAAPLVTHPIMGGLDDRGRLFVGDAVGANWNKKQLEANPPNRILMLEDTDGDGIYDKSTVFADKMTFPQGCCWLDGSLYVCSPPSVWKLTDTDGDGIADRREEIVTGFEYTGNAADVHGPWLHPNGRLYWCHGRKGHKVVGRDGQVVHEGLACGIWSCKPDGTDVQWHSLGCGDNPVKVDFTPDGEIIGVQNLYYSNPRGDTIVHWLYGGVYERADQLKAIEGLPRTLEQMPVMYNFGHVAVSGCCFARSGALFPANPLQLFVTHFNTQRLVRMELTRDGATYKAAENEFLKLHDPDIHLTDVMECGDGSLLLTNTGGWFRIGCPSSLMAKPDMLGAVYRIKRSAPAEKGAPLAEAKSTRGSEDLLAGLASSDPHVQLHACEAIAKTKASVEKVKGAVMKLLAGPLDPALEHAALFAAAAAQLVAVADVREAQDPRLLRRLLIVREQAHDDPAGASATAEIAARHLDSADADLARTALGVVTRSANADDTVAPKLIAWLDSPRLSAQQLSAVQGFGRALIDKPQTQSLVTRMLAHPSRDVQQAGIGIIANQTSGVANLAWIPALERFLAEDGSSKVLVIDAIKKLKTNQFDDALQKIANDTKQPLSLRLRALGAVKGLKLTPETFAMLQSVLVAGDSSAAARIQAATMLASAPLQKEQIANLAPTLATVGPIELKALLALVGKCKDADLARAVARSLATNPAIASQQESIYRTTFSSQPPDIFETILLPAIHNANAATDAKRRLLGPLSDKVAAEGSATAGRAIYESGKGTCIACHQIGDKGRAIGPNLSKIGAIRTGRDLLESILFPSNTLARDYEAHIIETSGGQSVMGVIKSHTAEGLLVVDAAGQENNIPHGQIVGDTQLATSLMPLGLDQTLSEKELCDLVAFLCSLKN
jgi:putative membrane-bound dehydrogenase-like protein